jgi:hypothetical protein
MDSVMIRNAASARATTPANADQGGKLLPAIRQEPAGNIKSPQATPERVTRGLKPHTELSERLAA